MIKLIIIFKRLIKLAISRFFFLKIIYKYSSAYIDSKADFQIKDFESLELGENVSIGSFTVIRIFDDPLNIGFRNSKLTIGDNTYIGEFNNIRACGGTISIGANCLISQFVSLIASNHQFNESELISKQPWSTLNNFIKIGNNVWIGANVVILPGVVIGDGVIIGAGSIVTKSIQSNVIVTGNPAKVLRHLEN